MRNRTTLLAVAVALLAGAMPARATLAPVGCVKAPSSTETCASVAPGLGGVNGVALSADGHALVASSQTGSAGTAFGVDTATGALTPTGCVSLGSGADACPGGGGGHDGYSYASDVAISPDARSVYF